MRGIDRTGARPWAPACAHGQTGGQGRGSRHRTCTHARIVGQGAAVCPVAAALTHARLGQAAHRITVVSFVSTADADTRGAANARSCNLRAVGLLLTARASAAAKHQAVGASRGFWAGPAPSLQSRKRSPHYSRARVRRAIFPAADLAYYKQADRAKMQGRLLRYDTAAMRGLQRLEAPTCEGGWRSPALARPCSQRAAPPPCP